MFEFKNKTINSFRSEVFSHLGKGITLGNGKKPIISNVTENEVHYISSLTGVSFKRSNGEFDWDKNVDYVKMYGFVVETSYTSGESTMTNSEKILIPFNMRNKKQYVECSYSGTILK